MNAWRTVPVTTQRDEDEQIRLRWPAATTQFSDSEPVTLKNGRQGRIYQDVWGNTAYLHDDGIVYVYFFPRERRNLDYIEAIPLHDFAGAES